MRREQIINEEKKGGGVFALVLDEKKEVGQKAFFEARV